MDDSQLAQELTHKTAQVEILHEQLTTYSDSLDKEKRRVSMLALENQNYQRHLQQLQGPPPSLPPWSPKYVNDSHLLPYSVPGMPPEPCPLCGKRFSTTEQLTVHAAKCMP